MLDVLSQPFYQIEDKKPLLVEYQRLFNVSLCDTCPSSYIKAYNELKTFYKNQTMAKKSETKNQERVKKYTLKPEYEGTSTNVSGIIEPFNNETPDNVIEENFELIGFLYQCQE